MPLNNSTNISFSAGNFTSSTPIGGQEALTGFGVNTSSNYRWANKTAQLNLGNTDYGYVMFDISYTVTGTADIVGISFAGPDMPVSYSTTLSGLFKPLVDGTYLKLTAGVTTRIYAIVNATKKSNLLPITLTVGRRGSLPSNVTVNIQYNCTDVGPLYSYLCGLHVYSPYDAANTPTLQTYLYSYTPIGSWANNTELYASPNFTQPAYPYYYSYGSNVYKVGDELERSFGEKKYIYVEKKWALGKTRVYNRIEGPQSWKGRDRNGFTTQNFVYPTMNNIGRLRQILPAASLSQPSSYRYYLGADSNAQSAADFFTQFDFNNRQVHTVTGYVHALQRLSRGFASGYYKDLKFQDWDKFAVTVALLGLAVYDFLYVGFDATGWGKIATSLARFDVWINSTATKSAGSNLFGNIFGPFSVPLIKIFIIVAAAYAIYLLTRSTRETIEEPLITLKYRYANTPYLNNGTRLYTNTGLTTYISEYYCDGIYFYNQLTGSIISNKEISYSLNALLDLDPLQKGLAYSIAADQPDSGSVIFDFSKLLALPYCSGKPDTVSSTNTNIDQSVSFPPLNLGGDLLTYPASVTISLPEGSIVTTGSQADANAEALQYLNQLTGSYVSGSYGTPKTGSAAFGAYFTHEIKVESTPNTGSVFFDNTNGAGLTVGKSLYYDIGGFQKVFNGYYAADSGSVSPYSNYRTFFKTVNGAVTDILAMGSSGATTVTSVINSATYPVQTSNQNYTSDWYWYQPSYNELSADIPYVTNLYVNPNSLYTTSSLKSGFLLPNTSSFYTYDSISSTSSYTEATPGFYYAFTSYENGYMFAYSTATTISINLTEVCFTDYAVGEPYGVNISGATGSASSSFYYPVNLTLSAYNGGSLLTSFPATASSEGVTYVSFPAPITKDSNVTNVTMTIDSANPNNKVLYITGSFVNCNPTTPAPTPNPTTAAPTPNPTAPFSAIVSYSNLTAQDACDNPQGSFSMTGNNGTFCLSSAYTATNWTTLPQTTYWLSYDGQVRQVYHPANSNTVTTINACAACPTPNPTPNPTTAAPTTAAPTPNPTTAAPTPNPTTPAPTTAAPTPLVTELNGFVSIIGGAEACSGGEYGEVRFDVSGTTLCDATSIVYLPSSVWSDFIFNQEFYVSDRVSSVFKSRKFRRNGNNNTASPLLACEDCPTPNPTPNPTTAAPTPNPTTAAPTNPPTPPPTNPPTPPPTAPFSGIVSYSTISALEVCNNPQGSFSMTGNNGTFCLSSTYTATNWTSLATGTYWLAFGGQVRQVFHPSNANTVTTTNACSVCPTPSPTPNPTTAAPTNPPTPPPTPNPTTAAPTPNPTPNPTAAAPAFSFLVTNGRANSSLACATTAKPNTLYAYDSDFSLVDRFYSTNTFPYTVFNGNNLWYSNGVYAVLINTLGYVDDIITCPTPAPTAAPTTAAPTNPPTPPPTNPPTPPPTTPPTPPPTTPPTPPPTTPPTPPPTNPPTTPPTPPPTNPPTTPPTPPPTPPPTIAYFYYNVTPCFSGGGLIARSTDDGLNGVYTANGTCYIIDGIAIPQAYDFTIDPANYVGGSCFVSACGYTPPTPSPAPAELYICDPFIGCYQDPLGDSYNIVCLNCDQV